MIDSESHSSKIYSRLNPEEAVGIPLAEVDNSVMEDTYCVIGKSWGQTYIYRYSRLPTLYLFHPYSSVRRASIAFTTHVCYDICIIIIVFANLIDLAMPNSLPLLFERVSIIFYIAETLHETLARGFIFGSYAYLKDPLMCFDFIITLLSLPDIELNSNNTFGIQSLRGIRALNLISKIPGVQILAQGIMLSLFRMYGVAMIMFLFLLTVTLTAKQLFMGVFLRKCVANPSSSFDDMNISYSDYINNDMNWAVNDHNEYLICGNNTGAQRCPENYTCLFTTKRSFDSDYTSFDTFGLSLINSFRLVTQDEWEPIYDSIIEGVGAISFLFFLPVIFFGSFFLLNLMLVVVTVTFDSVMNKHENRPLRSYKYHSAFRFDITRLALYPLPASPKVVKRVFYERDEILVHQQWMRENLSKVKRIITLKLLANANKELHEDEESLGTWGKFRKNVKKICDSKPFYYFILATILFNTVLLASEHARMSQEFTLVSKYCNVVVTLIFALEVIMYLIATGKRYFFSWWNILDFLIVFQSIISILLDLVAEYSIFRSLKLIKLMKVQKVWPALQTVINVILNSIQNIIRLLIIMCLIIFTFAVIGNRVLGQRLKENIDIPRWSFITFGGSLFTVFEIFAGEWYEPLTSCMRTTKVFILCPIIIIPYYLIGFLVILSVFTAVLLSSFDVSTLKVPSFPKRKKTGTKEKEIDIPASALQVNSDQQRGVWLYLKKIIESSLFEQGVFFLIIASCIVMAFEDAELKDYPTQKKIVDTLSLLFTVLFVIEMLMRWIGFGIKNCFSDAWMRFDFILVLLSLVELFVINVFVVSEQTESSMKSLRALRPVRLIPRWKGLHLIVQSFLLSVPAVFHSFLVVLFIWLPFAILGVHFFAGRFFRCVDEYQEMVTEKEIQNKTDCIQKGYSWEEMFYNFNHIGNSYISLFQLAMFTGWTNLVKMMVDFKTDMQPVRDNKSGYYIFVVVFVFLGAFFSLNLFVAVAVHTFKTSEKRVRLGTSEVLLTDTQRRYYGAMLRLGKRKAEKRTEPPSSKYLHICYAITYSLWFRVLILLFIIANTVTIALNSFDDSTFKRIVLHHCDTFFTISYSLEFLIKILGLRKFYFNDFWNIFDLTVLSLHIIGNIFQHTPSTETNRWSFLYAFRLLRILRLLRLTDILVDLRRLLHAIIASIPALINISILLFLLIFIYSIFGMSFFSHIMHHGTISSTVNFQTFAHSYLLLFRLTTAQGWEELLESLSIKPPLCSEEEGNCGNFALSLIFLLSFIIISNIILVNIFIAVILENYIEAVMQENDVISDDNLANFYRIWKHFDPKATQFILYDHLSDFLNLLNKDMRIPKPNHIAIAYMNLPLTEGKRIHCLNVLQGILDIKAGDVEDSSTFRILCDQVQKKFDKMFPELKQVKFVETTLQLRRREFAARVIQANIRKMRDRKMLNI